MTVRIGQRHTRRQDLIAWGDSVTEGGNSSIVGDRWVNRLQTLLRQAFPTLGLGSGGGSGFVNARWEVYTDPPTTGSPPDGFYGFGRMSVYLPGDGDSVTFEDVAGTSVRVWHPAYSQAGALNIEIDGPLSPAGGYVEDFASNEYIWCNGITNCNTVAANGSFTLIGYVTSPDWTPAQAIQQICGWQNVVRLQLFGTGSGAANKLSATVIQGGTGKTAQSTADWQTSTGWADGAGGWIKAHIDLTADTVKFSYSNDPVTTPYGSVSWTDVETKALSGTITGADSTSSAIIGNQSSVVGNAGWLGKIYKATGLITGVAAFDMDFTTQLDGAWFFMDEVGNRFNSSILTAAGASGHQYKTVIQPDDCGVFATGYEGHGTGLFALDTYTDVELPDDDPHDVLVSYYASGTGLYPTASVDGIQVFDGDEDSGIQVIGAGHGGYQALHFTLGTEVAITEQVRLTHCPLAFICFGINEFGNDVDPEEYRDNMATIIGAIRDANQGTTIVLIAAWETVNASPTYPWSDYVAVMRDFARRSYIEMVDFSNPDDWPQPGTDAGDASGYYADGTHPNSVGHLAMAQRIFEFVEDLTYSPFAATVEQPGPTDPLRRVVLPA